MRYLKKVLTLIFLLSLFKLGLAIEPELVFEMPVEGKIVGGDLLDGKLILSTQKRLWVSTPEGKESFRMNLGPNQGVVASEDGKFFGITTYSKDAPVGFLAAEGFELYSADGKRLCAIENPGASDFCVSNGAKLIVGISSGEGRAESRLVFYNHSGEMILNAKVRSPQGVQLSSNGKYVFITSAKDGLLAFDDSGDSKVNFGLCEQFTISSDGEYVAIVSDGNLKFYHQGKPTSDPLQINSLVRGMSFSPDDKYLSVIDKKNLYLFEVQTGKLIWRHTLDEPELSFVSADMSPDAERIIAGIDFDKGRGIKSEDRHTRGLVYIFDEDGKITWEREFSYKLWSTLFPRVQLSADGTNFSVMTREKAYVFNASQSDK